MINNPDLDLSLVKMLAKDGVSVEHVDKAEEADVLVVIEKGKGFGVNLDQAQDILKLDKPKVVVCINDYAGDNKTVVVKPMSVGRNLKIKISDIAAAVLSVAPPEFEIEDDTDSTEEPSCERQPLEVEFVDDGPSLVSLRNRLARVLGDEENFPKPEKAVSVVGVKNGVGTTTLCACLTHALAGLSAIHVDPSGTGHVYYGGNVEEALAAGNYFTVCPPDTRLAILDGGNQGNILIAVIDDSIMSFQCLKRFLADFTPDMVVINRVRGGVTDTVFKTEFPGIMEWVTVVDNYDASIKGQNEGKPPTLFSPDMARDIGKLAAKIREMLGL